MAIIAKGELQVFFIVFSVASCYDLVLLVLVYYFNILATM